MEFVIWVETPSRIVQSNGKWSPIEQPASLRAMEEIGLTLQDGAEPARETFCGHDRLCDIDAQPRNSNIY